MGGEPQGSLLGPVAFSTFINNMEKVMESSAIRLAHDTKLGGNSHYSATQRDLDWQKK